MSFSTTPNILSDSDDAKSGRAEGLYLVRYIEIFLTVEDPKSSKIVAQV